MQAYTTAVAHAMPRSATHSADGCFLVGRARRGSESIRLQGPRARSARARITPDLDSVFMLHERP